MDPEAHLLRLYDTLARGRLQNLIAMFDDEPWIDAPGAEPVRDQRSLHAWVQEQSMFLRSSRAKVRPMPEGVTRTDDRIAVEISLDLATPLAPIALPVLMVGDLRENQLTKVRIYHDTSVLTGEHLLRDPMFDTPNSSPLPPAVSACLMALRIADIDRLIELFVSDIKVIEPRGGDRWHQGIDPVEVFFERYLGAHGAQLQVHTATVADHRCVLEYTAHTSVGVAVPPQPAAAVFSLFKQQITAIRLYDDVGPPSTQIN